MTEQGEVKLDISERWSRRLTAAELGSFDALMNFKGGVCVSSHKHRSSYRISLPDGDVIFLKRDFRTMFKHVLGASLRGRRSEPLVARERFAIETLSRLGINTAEVIAFGQHRRLGLAHQGVLVMGKVQGVPMDEYLRSARNAQNRLETMRGVGVAIGKLYKAGLSWPDLLMKHVFVDDGGCVGLVDLERLRPAGRSLGRDSCRQLSRFVAALRGGGLGGREILAFVETLDCGKVCRMSSLLMAEASSVPDNKA